MNFTAEQLENLTKIFEKNIERLVKIHEREVATREIVSKIRPDKSEPSDVEVLCEAVLLIYSILHEGTQQLAKSEFTEPDRPGGEE